MIKKIEKAPFVFWLKIKDFYDLSYWDFHLLVGYKEVFLTRPTAKKAVGRVARSNVWLIYDAFFNQ